MRTDPRLVGDNNGCFCLCVSKGHIDLRTSLTYGFPSPKQSSRCGKTWTTYGSKSFPSMLHSISKANSAPGGHNQPSIHQKYSRTQITFPTTASVQNIPALICSNQPSRLLKFFLSWMASVSVVMISCCLRDRIPSPLTSPAKP